jgi:carbon-monoxide dehydrogenase medium subunit
MKPAPFAYHLASGVDHAVELISTLGDEAKFLAGGQSLVQMMNFRLARPTALIDISRLSELSYLQRRDGSLTVGALARHRSLETAGDLEGLGVLSRTARWIGHLPIRMTGTFGGSLAHADPAAEWCVLSVLLDAEIVARRVDAERIVPASAFFLGFFTTALEPDELLVETRFPRAPGRAALTEFAPRQGDFALVIAAAALELDGARVRDCRLTLGGVDATPIRLPGAEAVLAGEEPGPDAFREAAAVAARSIDPASDSHASAAYRRRLTEVLVHRVLDEAMAGAAP